MRHIALGQREADVMEVLWEHGPSIVSEVREMLAVPLAYTTVLTILQNLESKGYVEHQDEGRAHRFRAIVGRVAARRSALRDLSAKLFDGSAALLLTHLVSEEQLSPAEMRRIQELLQRRLKEG